MLAYVYLLSGGMVGTGGEGPGVGGLKGLMLAYVYLPSGGMVGPGGEGHSEVGIVLVILVGSGVLDVVGSGVTGALQIECSIEYN